MTSIRPRRDEVYRRLAKKLDSLPNGFPASRSGVELRLLAKLFSPAEAELACCLTLEAQDAETIAGLRGEDAKHTLAQLKSLTRKGLIEVQRGNRGLTFSLMPFIVGFYERQNARIDAEFAQLFEAYYREVFKRMVAVKPALHRVLPVERAISLSVDVLPHQRASAYLDSACSWGVLKCICRVQKRLIGEGCEHRVENCLVFSSRSSAFDRSEAIQAINRERALEILDEADREGLVHSTGNMREGIQYICNCCACCCGIMRAVQETGVIDAVAASDFRVAFNADLCRSCGLCLERCMFAAMDEKDGQPVIDPLRCRGCGLCVTVCSPQALRLERKPVEDRADLPGDENEWRRLRAAMRSEGETWTE